MTRLLFRGLLRRLPSNIIRVRNSIPRRFLSNKVNDIAPDASQTTRLLRVNHRLPKFLQRYTTPLITAPVTHISAFLLLHELTAIVPLFGLAGLFHYSHWLPPYISEGAWVSSGVEIFGKWFRKRGWLGEEGVARRDRWWNVGEVGSRVVVEFATAWVIVKALLPLRIPLSVWATPWFARVALVPSINVCKRMVGKMRKKSPPSSAAGTGATATGVVGESKTKP